MVCQRISQKVVSQTVPKSRFPKRPPKKPSSKHERSTKQQMIHSMNASLRAIDAHGRYVAGELSWNDGRRGVDGGALSALGDNITDVSIWDSAGNMCQFIRPSNMDETIGVMDAKDILMRAADGTNLSVQELLDDIEPTCKYMGYTSIDAKTSANQKVVVRFQTAWVPITTGTTKIVPQHYSYQTRDRSNPRNLLVLGTPTGVHVHNDTAGGNKLFAHSVSESGEVTNHWFEAESNRDCMVGHAANVSSKRARVSEMGIRGMGPRTNCFVTVAIPNTQKQETSGIRSLGVGNECAPAYRSLCDVGNECAPVYRSINPCVGRSYAANVSVAKESVGTCTSNAISIVRPEREPIVVTVLTYNTVEVPEGVTGATMKIATTDVALGVADLDRQYELVKRNGGVVCKLSELSAMLHKLTPEHVRTIAAKVTEDPAVDPMVPTSSALAAFA